MLEKSLIFVLFVSTFASIAWSVSVEEILLSSNEVERENEIENVPSPVTLLFFIFPIQFLATITFIWRY